MVDRSPFGRRLMEHKNNTNENICKKADKKLKLY